MKTKFTPGPWFTHREGLSTIYVEARLRPGIVQEVAACGPTEAGQEQQEANAALISAAPNLLEALRTLLDCAKYGDVFQDADAWNDARAAIAKATGGEA